MERIINILLKVFIHRTIPACYTRQQLIHYNKFILWKLINDFICLLTAFCKMWDYHIVGVILLPVIQQFLKELKVIVVNIKVNSGIRAQSTYKRIVNNLFVRTQLIK